MLFEINKASTDSRETPCENCVPMFIEIPSNTSDYELNAIKEFYDNRISNGIVRVWGIEINSPEDLMKLEETVGYPLILCRSYVDDKTPCILIYDDYIE